MVEPIELRIKADGNQAKGVLSQLAAELDRTAKSASGTAAPALQGMADELRTLEAEGIDAGAALKKIQDEGGALEMLARQFDQAAQGATGALKPALEQAAAEMRNLAAQGGGADQKLKNMTRSGSALGDVMKRVGSILAGAFAARELISAAAQMETLQRGMEAVYGSTQAAAREMDFARDVAARTGAEVTRTAQSWLGLSASVRGTAVEGEPARAVFEAVANAMAKAGKTAAQTDTALLAIQQVASKGTVAMEELRGQLGEALPGALQAAAAGLGITTQDLIRLTEAGQITAQDLFPALAKGLNDLYGTAPKAQTLAQEIVGIKNALVDMAADLGDNGGLAALKVGAELAQTGIVLLDDALVSVGKTLGTLAAAVATLDFSHVGEAFADIEKESETRLLKAAKNNETLRTYIAAVGSESLKTALAAQQSAAATEKAGQSAAAAAGGYLKLANGYELVNKYVAQQIVLAEAEVKAAKARGDAAVAQARLLGDESAVRKAVGDAAKLEADALVALSAKRDQEVAALKEELGNKKQALAAAGDESQKRKEELAELDQLIKAKQLEADQTRAQADAALANARAKGEEAQAATAALEAAQAGAIAKSADARASLSLLETQRNLAGQSAELARLMGNEEAARSFRIQQLEIDVKITRAKAEVQRAEAEGSIAVAQATMQELRVKGELTQVKEAELNASIKLAEAKLKEADATRQAAGVTEQAISNLRNFGNEAGRAGDAGHSAGRRAAAGWNETKGAIDGASSSLQNYSKLADGVRAMGGGFVNKEGMSSDEKGNAISVGRQSWLSIYQMTKSLGVSDAQARAIASQAYGPDGKYSPALQNSMKRGAMDFMDVTEAARRAAEQAIRFGPQPTAAGATAANSPSARPAGPAMVSNITLPGVGKYSIGMSDAQSGKQLEDLLGQLTASRRRAA